MPTPRGVIHPCGGAIGCGKALGTPPASGDSARRSTPTLAFRELLACLRGADLIEEDGSRISLSEMGRLAYDRVLLCFYRSAPSAGCRCGTRTRFAGADEREPKLPELPLPGSEATL
jgi:hypothetical protein